MICRKGKIPSCWQIAESYFVSKEEKSESMSQFWTTSLLNVEVKIFFSFLAKCLTRYMTGNQYISMSVQKGGVPRFSGCLEHTTVITQVVSEAKRGKKDLTVVWLDLANTYGTIPHMLILEALRYYHIPKHIRQATTMVSISALQPAPSQHHGKDWRKELSLAVTSL